MPRKTHTTIRLKKENPRRYYTIDFNDCVVYYYEYRYDDYNDWFRQLLYKFDEDKHEIKPKECSFMKNNNIEVIDFHIKARGGYLRKLTFYVKVPIKIFTRNKNLTKFKAEPLILQKMNIKFLIYEKPKV